MYINIQDVTEKDFLKFNDIPVIDCHTHVWSVDEIYSVADVETRYRIDKLNVLAINSYDEKCRANNLLCLLFKLLYPGKVYAFGSLQYPPVGAPVEGTDFLRQVERLMALGFDGMKMMEGKPDTRKRIGIPLDSPIYDRYYEYLEAHRISLLYHVNDPGVYWDRERVPQFVIEKNWAYLDDSFVSKEGLYSEVEGILKKFPRLRVIFAHFYFMDEEGIDRASEFLDKWPEVSFDLTPGWLFKSFAQDYGGWRDFFIKYQDRILFGTDNDYGKALELIYTMRTVLETDNQIRYWDTDLAGMKLDREILAKIYGENFLRYAGNAPRTVEPGPVLEECGRIGKTAETSPRKDEILKDLQEIAGQLRKPGKEAE